MSKAGLNFAAAHNRNGASRRALSRWQRIQERKARRAAAKTVQGRR